MPNLKDKQADFQLHEAVKPPVQPARLVIAIVHRGMGSKVASIINQKVTGVGTIMLGRGTATSEMMDFLGLLDLDKDIVMCITRRHSNTQLLQLLTDELEINKPGHGIALTLPIDHAIAHGSEMDLITREKFEARKGEPVMQGDFEYSLIFTIVNRGFADDVMEAARAVGARGGTIINGRGTGVHEQMKFMGVAIEPEKDIVLIVAPEKDRAKIMQSISSHVNLAQPGRGLSFSVPVAGVTGINTAPPLSDEEREQKRLQNAMKNQKKK